MNWEARLASLIPSKLRRLWASRVFRLVLILAIGKAVVILVVFFFESPASVLRGMGTKWDSNYYEIIATQGYGPSAPYVFSPVYPAIIKLVYSYIGNAWVSGLLVTNSLSFVFPLLLFKAFGYKTALFAELFPTYLVYTTVAYSDVVALVFLASSLLLLMRGSVIRSSMGMSGAILTFYNLAWTLPSFLFALLAKGRLRNLLFYALPLVTGWLILLWFKIATGDYLGFFRLESPWGLGFANPLAQAYYLLCPSGQGSFTCQPWAVSGVLLTPAYWLVRNLLFEAFYLFGAFCLLKTELKYRVFLFAYCLSVLIPLLFLVGFPALSIPRLLLPAFPVFVGYSTLLKGKRYDIIYLVLCLGSAATISVVQYLSYFS